MLYFFKPLRTLEGERHARNYVEVVIVRLERHSHEDVLIKAESWDEAVAAFDIAVPQGLDPRRFEDYTKDGIS
jgi:hypothetical protein